MYDGQYGVLYDLTKLGYASADLTDAAVLILQICGAVQNKICGNYDACIIEGKCVILPIVKKALDDE